VKQVIFFYSFLLVLFLIFSCGKTIERRNRLYDRLTNKQDGLIPKFPQPNPLLLKEKKRYAYRFYKRILGAERFNGQFLVAKNGRVFYFKASGYANFKKKKKIKQNTPLHVASVSKFATALCVLRLVDRNRIKLDTDIRRYLPEIPYEGITVRMLLNHRSGLPYYGYFTYKTWDFSKKLTNRDLLQLLKKYKFPLYFKPNTKFSYCNTNFALLALIVERQTKKRFSQAMCEWIFEPLHMNNTFIITSDMEALSLSISHNSKLEDEGFDYLDAVYGDKNMYTTAHDLLKLDMATYSSTFLSDSLKKQLFKGYSYEHKSINNYGLGLRMKEQKGMCDLFFHTGWWHGNTACFTTLRQDTICIVAISNAYSRSVFNMGMLAEKYGNYPLEFTVNPLD
jgi:CubicO group peptidase (beta-lactamase class C family)